MYRCSGAPAGGGGEVLIFKEICGGDLSLLFPFFFLSPSLSSPFPFFFSLIVVPLSLPIIFSLHFKSMLANDSALTPSLLPPPSLVTRALVQNAFCLTEKGRDFLLRNPTARLPNDYAQYPGKMDHTTALALRIGGLKGDITLGDIYNQRESNELMSAGERRGDVSRSPLPPSTSPQPPSASSECPSLRPISPSLPPSSMPSSSSSLSLSPSPSLSSSIYPSPIERPMQS